MNARASDPVAPVENETGPRTIQVWRIGVVVLGLLMLLAHPLLGTTVPLRGGNLVAGLLLPLLLFATAFLPRRDRADAPAEPGRPAEPVAQASDLVAATALAGPEDEPDAAAPVEARARHDRLRMLVLVLTPLAALVMLVAIDLFAAVVCFGAGSIAQVLLRHADDE